MRITAFRWLATAPTVLKILLYYAHLYGKNIYNNAKWITFHEAHLYELVRKYMQQHRCWIKVSKLPIWCKKSSIFRYEEKGLYMIQSSFCNKWKGQIALFWYHNNNSECFLLIYCWNYCSWTFKLQLQNRISSGNTVNLITIKHCEKLYCDLSNNTNKIIQIANKTYRTFVRLTNNIIRWQLTTTRTMQRLQLRFTKFKFCSAGKLTAIYLKFWTWKITVPKPDF